MFHYILQFLNIAGIVSNGFIIAFTSQWGNENYPYIGDKLICVAVFEVQYLTYLIFRFNYFISPIFSMLCFLFGFSFQYCPQHRVDLNLK
jgi:hypothetical protein